jgi:hypothetical protein
MKRDCEKSGTQTHVTNQISDQRNVRTLRHLRSGNTYVLQTSVNRLPSAEVKIVSVEIKRKRLKRIVKYVANARLEHYVPH